MLFDDRKKQDPTRGTGYVVPASAWYRRADAVEAVDLSRAARLLASLMALDGPTVEVA
jgi:hypothetical protein